MVVSIIKNPLIIFTLYIIAPLYFIRVKLLKYSSWKTIPLVVVLSLFISACVGMLYYPHCMIFLLAFVIGTKDDLLKEIDLDDIDEYRGFKLIKKYKDKIRDEEQLQDANERSQEELSALFDKDKSNKNTTIWHRNNAHIRHEPLV